VDGKDDWQSWCKSEEFALDSFAYRSIIRLGSQERICWVDDPKKLDQRYGREASLSTFAQRGIDWQAVADDYAGCIIAPYNWEYRLNLMWYYGWDCASGCIWDARVIESIDCIDAQAVT
jgi:hypothetical protein